MTPHIGKELTLKFGKHKFPIIIEDIAQARLADLVNKPEQRYNIDGIAYTPTVVTFTCDVGKLHFILEDIDSIVETLSGMTFIMGEQRVEFS